MNDQVTPEPQCDPDNLATAGVLAELESAMRESDATSQERPLHPHSDDGPAQGMTADSSPIDELQEQIAQLRRENQELNSQAQAMFEAMDKKGRANWLQRDERIRELTAQRDHQEALIRELQSRAGGSDPVAPDQTGALRGQLAQAERERDEALALRDKAEQKAVELFGSLSPEDRESWLDRDAMKSQLDEMRATYEARIAEISRHPQHDPDSAIPLLDPATVEALREELMQAIRERDEAKQRAETLSSDDESLRSELETARRELDEARSREAAGEARPPAPPIPIPDDKSTPEQELEYLRTVAAELVERHEENQSRIERLQAQNDELARALADAQAGEGSKGTTASGEPIDTEIEGLFSAIQERETLLDELQTRLDEAERRASEAGASDPELVAVLYERLAQAETRERDLVEQLARGGEAGAASGLVASPDRLHRLLEQHQDLAGRLAALEDGATEAIDTFLGEVPSLDLDGDEAGSHDPLAEIEHHYERLGRLVSACEGKWGAQSSATGSLGDHEDPSLQVEIDRLMAQLQERDQLLDELQVHFEQIIANAEGGIPGGEAQNDHLQAKINEMIEREQELRLEIAQQAEEDRKLRLEVDRMCQQVAEAAIRNQELLHLRQVIGEFAGREQYIEELELRLEALESGGGEGGSSHREENRLLRAQVEQLSREMESISDLHEAVKDLESARMQSIRLQDELHAREVEANGLTAELERTRAERDREIQSLRIELAKAEASRARDRLDSAGVVDLWSTRGTSAGSTTHGTHMPPPQRPAASPAVDDEGPTSIDERIRAFRQHLDGLEHSRTGSSNGNGKRKGGGGFFSRIFGRGR